MSERLSVKSVSRQVIENKLLTAITDAAVVAILTSDEDLAIMIEALRRSKDTKAQKMAEDFGQLRRAAFPRKPGE
jgi:hypothetical protein